MYICMYIRIQIGAIRSRHYDHQGEQHDEISFFGDKELVAKTKFAIHFNGFYYACPSSKQCSATSNLNSHRGLAHNPRISITAVSVGTSLNQHCGCTGDNGSLSIILYVNHHAGIVQSYSEIRELQSEVVEHVVDFYQATLEIEGSERVWGSNWIASLPSTRKAIQITPALLATMGELVKKGAIIPSDGGGYDCNCGGCVKPEDKRTSYTFWAQNARNALHNKPGIWTVRKFVKEECSSAPNVLDDLEQEY